ncbi:MAG: ABC transporter ATP-binding protein [Dehalococcoidia bacterium]|nr:putative ABC transporter ATP-binding protein YknY [Chloroflexota bacterium]MBT9162012.1 putative ABC transporter ATP-binding protein YknY [Chloroflexota bacterium]
MIRTAGLVKTYRMGKIEVPALGGVDIEISEGEYVALVGPSGSGKSTLLNMIGCLDRPTSGSVFIEGVDVSGCNGSELARIRRQKMGFIFQMFNLIPTLDALENVMLPMTFAGSRRGERITRARELLELVGLSERAKHKPSELSGGEQQRVAIARALANDPPVLLADEPTGNLDTKTGKAIIGFLEKLNEEGKTMIVVTHNPEIASKAQRVISMRDDILER